MLRKIILKSPTEEMVLPVTPGEYKISHGQRVEIVNINGLGDIALAGLPTLCQVSLDVLLPTSGRSYTNGVPQGPEWYLWHWRMWADEGTVLRFIVSDTYINLPVLIEDFTDGEREGSNDRRCTLTLREYRNVEVKQANTATGNAVRAVESPPQTARPYTVASGDCLSVICRRFYGDASLYGKLAAYNGIKNANLIYPGQVVKLPPRDQL